MVKIIVTVFATTAVIATFIVVGALVVTKNNTNAACEAENDVRVVLTKVLTRSQTLAPKNTDYSPAEKTAAQIFYTKALEELEPKSC